MKQGYVRSIRKMGEFTLTVGFFFAIIMLLALAAYQSEGDRASETIWNYSMVCVILFHSVTIICYIVLLMRKDFGELNESL